MINFIIEFLYEINNQGLLLWNDGGKLKYKKFREIENQEQKFLFIKKNKTEILDILVNSNVTSGDNILPIIYKIPNFNNSLSSYQEGLLFLQESENASCAYNAPMILELSSDTNINIFKKSILELVDRYEILRTIFIKSEDGYLYQNVANENISIPEVCINKEFLEDTFKKEINKSFDLWQDLPIRATIYKVENKIFAIIVIHHIAFDGWSYNIFLDELKSIYIAKSSSQDSKLQSIYIQYKDFALWQRLNLDNYLNNQKEYWKNNLKDTELLNFPIDYKRPTSLEYQGNDFNFNIPKDLADKVKFFSKENNYTQYSVMLACFYILLHKYTNQSDLIIGTPFANRNNTYTEKMLGYFINTLPVRLILQEGMTFRNLCSKLNSELIEVQKNQEYPLSKIIKDLNLEKDPSRHPLFQILFSVQSFGTSIESSFFRPISAHKYHQVAQFDLSLFIDNSKADFECRINYSTALFDKQTIKRISEHFLNIVRSALDISDIQINQTQMLSKSEYQLITQQWNKTQVDYPESKTINDLFDEIVSSYGDRNAVIFNDIAINYAELNTRSNQLANFILKEHKHVLSEKSLANNNFIGLYLDRSLEMVISIISILKIGAAYVPFSPADPIERLEYKLKDSNCKIVLTSKHHIDNQLLNLNDDISFLCVEEILNNTKERSDHKPKTIVKPNDLAYVIYTSGTTGEPKGVMIEHRSLVNRLIWMKDKYDFNIESKVLQKTSYSFDVSVWELILPLISGGTVVLAKPEGHKDPKYIYDLINIQRINKLHFVPTMLRSFITFIKTIDSFSIPSVCDVFCSGEALSQELASSFKVLFPDVRLHNLYGPTEATIDVSFFEFNNQDDKLLTVPIGQPIQNHKLYVLDKTLNPVPIGVPGELYISGVGLARGYLGKEQLTNQRFLDNPFSSNTDISSSFSKIYKTGDIVKYLPNGVIEYIGRNDSQVKIKGFRIELREIESVISKLSNIKDSIVTTYNDNTGNTKLIAYYIAPAEIAEDDLLSSVAKTLPDYMIPNYFIKINKIPFNLNGKVDYKSLPLPNNKRSNSKSLIELPKTDIEQTLCDIWCKILDLNEIRTNENFFRLGGDSITSIQVVAEARKHGISITTKQIFDNPTISQLALITQQLNNNKEKANISLTGEFPSIPIVKWFFNCEFEKENHWNQAKLFSISDVSLDKLKASISTYYRSAEFFKLRYNKKTEKLFYTDKSKDLVIYEYDVCNSHDQEKSITELCTKWQAEFDLEKGPIASFGIISGLKDGRLRLFISLHHLIVDGVSWLFILDSIQQIYNGNSFSRTSSTYKDWSIFCYEYANKISQQTENYWIETSKKVRDYRLTTDKSMSSKKNFNISSQKILINQDLTSSIIKKCPEVYNLNVGEVLITSLVLSLSKINKNKHICMAMEGHGRENILGAPDISDAVGWFTSLYPICIDIPSDNNLNLIIKYIKEQLKSIPDNGLSFGLLKYCSSQEDILQQLDIDYPDVLFNYMGQFDTETKDSIFEIEKFISGNISSEQNHKEYLIEINAYILDKKLNILIDFSKSHFEESTIGKLLSQLEYNLQSITTHCLSKDSVEYTPSDFPTSEVQQYELDSVLKNILKFPHFERIMGLSELQKGMFFHAFHSPKSDQYNEQFIWELEGHINIDLFIKAWEAVINNYDALRSFFIWENLINPIQIVLQKVPVIWNIKDISTSESIIQERISIINKDRKNIFTLNNTPYRFTLLKESDCNYTFIWSYHHIILDGWSCANLIAQVRLAYEKLINGKDHSLLPAPSYFNYLQFIDSINTTESKVFWSDKLNLIDEPLNLQIVKPGVVLDNKKPIKVQKNYHSTIDTNLASQLESLAGKLGITINSIMQFAYGYLLSLYADPEITTHGTVFSGRNINMVNIDKAVGLFINTMPVILNWNLSGSIKDALKDIHNKIEDIAEHSTISLSELQQITDLDKDLDLFNTIFVFENYPLEKEAFIKNTTIKNFYANEKVNYPLSIICYKKEGLLNLQTLGSVHKNNFSS